jgi:hypothetical protein
MASRTTFGSSEIYTADIPYEREDPGNEDKGIFTFFGWVYTDGNLSLEEDV